MKPEQKAAAERKAARGKLLEDFNAALRKVDETIMKAREFVRSAGLREFTRAEVELMLKRANDRAANFDLLILKPLRADLKRRTQEKRKEEAKR